jgi:polar amino acid transport system substrate-binding protein
VNPEIEEKNMKTFKRLFTVLALTASAAFSAVAFAGCSRDPLTSGKLYVATSPDFPPYEFMDGKNYAGFDIEMAYAIGEVLDLQVKIVKTDFDGIINAVSTGKAGIGMSGLSVTEERKQNVDFTVNIANEAQVIIVKKGSGINTLADLKGKKVGSQNGTTGLDLAQYKADVIAESNYPDTDWKPAEGIGYDDCTVSAATDLVGGRLDAIIYDYSPSQEIVNNHPELEILINPADGKPYDLYTFYNAYICKKGTGFVDKVNGAIATLKENGKLAEIFAKYPTILPA